MLKQLAATILICSIPCISFASKARMEALGQSGEKGSFYISDVRTIFQNPAYANFEKNILITEWGTASNNDDSDTAPHAEGGIISDSGSFTSGAYFGSESRSQNAKKNTNFIKQDNRLDLIFAGDAGIQWGVKGYYTSNKDQVSVKKSNIAYGLGLGIVAGDIEGFVNLDLSDLSEGAVMEEDKWEAGLGLNFGLVYRLKDLSFLFEYEQSEYEEVVSGATTKGAPKSYTISVARVVPVNKTARIFSDLSFVYEKDDDYTNESNVDGRNYNSKKLPVTVAFEADARDWLIVRGSIKHNIWSSIEEDGKEYTESNSTVVAAGARLVFDRLYVDGIVGKGSDGSSKGTFGKVARIAVEYHF